MRLSLKSVYSSFAAHKLRSVLAMLGILLGALAFSAVQNISLALVRNAEREVEKLGPGLFLAKAGEVRWSRGGSARFGDESKTFTLQDAAALFRHLPQALDAAPFVAVTANVRYGDTKVPCQLVATTPNYVQVRNFAPDLGRFFTDREEKERDMVCVLGRTIARKLFTRPEDGLGRQVLFFRAALTVIGIMEEKGSDITGTDQDEQVFVPLSTYMRRMANQTWISGVYLNLLPGVDQEEVKKSAEAILRQRHRIGSGQKDDFSLLTARDTIQLQEQALSLVSTLGLISSSISFGVGGLGILSIMVLLVRLRRMEIGIRRALGARRKDIIMQFVSEAGLLAAAGGVLGVALALLLSLAVTLIASFPFVLNTAATLSALFGSCLLGLLSGLYPAWQASKVEILSVLQGHG